ncbi:MAG: phage integrase N-terminal SAM-like domain-containing protein [Anaerolineales bacterium]|nr:phage integrase N-terminal SAM-like domain-containing protein [Anaerolineales bacterium]
MRSKNYTYRTEKSYLYWIKQYIIPNDVHRQPDVIISHAQITDIYLTGLAVHKKGKLATLDQHIPVHVVRGGDDALELIMV